MSKNELSSKSVKELELICKDLGITYYVGKTHIKKDEMIKKILASTNDNSDVVTEEPVEQEVVVEPETSESIEPEDKEWIMKDKTKYIEEAEVNSLVAFYDEKGKPRTAALVNRSSSRKVIKVVTEFGWEFIVPYENVLWVRRGTRWPRGVYEILKGYNKNGKESAQK